jgi:putative acetyltransferase
VVAHVLLSRIELDTGDGVVPALALGPVGVLPAFQKQGYGSAVIRDALARRDDHLVILLGDPAYYRRFGFVPGAAHGITGPWSSSGDAWQVLPPAAGTPPGEARFPAPWAAV